MPRVKEAGCVPKELDYETERFWDVPFVVKTFLGLKLIPVLEKALTPARLNAGEFLAS